MNVTNKIKEPAKERGWSEYRLVKESGLATSTVANIYHRNTIPSIPTLETLCSAFGITLSQFFSDGNMVALSTAQTELLACWAKLSDEQREAIFSLMNTMN